MHMDSIFQLDDGDRSTFLQQMLHSFAATYICLWSYLPQPSNFLISVDGLYTGETNQSSSSSGSRAQTLFDEYRQGIFVLEDDHRIPGLAFRNGVPYMELNELDLLSLASIEPQLQLYQEARIKTAIFMGCNTGEIELGFSNDTQVNLEVEMRSWFPDDFSGQLPPPIELPPMEQPQQAFTKQFSALETTETKTTGASTSRKPSAFKRFRSALGPSTMNIRKPNMQKRAITFLRGLSLMRNQGRVQGSRPMSSTQLHHMMSERKRREVLNESFQALRSLLPPGTKKDKASVLASMTDYLASLKAQVEELTERNRDLEEKLQLLAPKNELSLSPNQSLDIHITHEAESTSQAQVIGLQVVLRGECSVIDLVTRILDFLRQVENASLLSVEADAQVVDSNPINIARLRLRIEGGDGWDESAFREAVRRVVADMAQ